jgi:hypothetical protein
MDGKPSSEELKQATLKNGFSNKIFIIIVVLIVIGLAFIFYKRKAPPPPPPQPVSTSNIIEPKPEELFDSLRERIEEIGDGKKYYKAGLMIMNTGEMPVSSTPSPESAPSPRNSKMAENFARALEHFKHAKEAVGNIEIKNPGEEDCRKAFVDADEKYMEAAKIFNDAAKALNTDPDAKKWEMGLSDAKAKYEMGEELMSSFLMDGCKGAYFQFMITKSQPERAAVFNAYRNFFAENFSSQRTKVELLFFYNAPPENASTETHP